MKTEALERGNQRYGSARANEKFRKGEEFFVLDTDEPTFKNMEPGTVVDVDYDEGESYRAKLKERDTYGGPGWWVKVV